MVYKNNFLAFQISLFFQCTQQRTNLLKPSQILYKLMVIHSPHKFLFYFIDPFFSFITSKQCEHSFLSLVSYKNQCYFAFLFLLICSFEVWLIFILNFLCCFLLNTLSFSQSFSLYPHSHSESYLNRIQNQIYLIFHLHLWVLQESFILKPQKS